MEAACQPARKPLAGWRLPEGKRATLARRPLPFLLVTGVVSGSTCYRPVVKEPSYTCAPSAPGCLAASGRQARLRQAAAGGIRSSGPTPTGSCWRTRQSPPNPLARFRAAATVRCVKTRACSDRSGRAASVAP
ncbi:hypothetical protein OV731_005274 [Escherichia coli]|nr:hypothetical protein [Escherichia coli]